MFGCVQVSVVVVFLAAPDKSEAASPGWRQGRCGAADCAVTSWSSWASCSSSCRGTQLRTRTKAREESCGDTCPHPLRETRPCNTACQNDGFRVHNYGPCQCSAGFTGSCCESRARCHEGRIAYNKCGERCKCQGGKLTECTRIRKEFTSMTRAERAKYVRAVKLASTDPRYKPEHDRLLTSHKLLFRTGIHEIDSFLPWHRWFILQYENLLRKIDCMVTVAYWDWSQASGSAWRGEPSDVWYSGASGFGGNGSPCVETGPFKWPTWKLMPSAGSGCLRRKFIGTPPDAIAVQEVLATPASDFDDFEFQLRVSLHDNVHCLIGGTMCIEDAASAPEFFLHHGFVDKLWADWQAQSPTHRDVYFSALSHVMPGTTYSPRHFLDLAAHPGGVRVEYKPVPRPLVVNGAQEVTVPFKAIGALRPRFTVVNERAMKLFHLSADGRRRARKFATKLNPVDPGQR